jgi:hypothetical protein
MTSRRESGGQPERVQIITEASVRTRELLRRRNSSVRAHVALVLVDVRGTPQPYAPNDRPTVGELLWKRVRTVYEVDTGQHSAWLDDEIPSRDDAFPFRAAVDLEWQVNDPLTVVQRHIVDTEALVRGLRPEVRSRLRRISRRYPPDRVAAAEDEMNDDLEVDPLGGALGLRTRAYVRLSLESGLRSHAEVLRDLEHRLKVEARSQDLRMAMEQNKQTVVAYRLDFYRQAIAAGDMEQFALRIAENPEDIHAVMDAVRADRDTARSNAIDFFSRLAESNLIDRHEMNDIVKETLDWLRESVARVVPQGGMSELGARRPPDLPAPPVLPGADRDDDRRRR